MNTKKQFKKDEINNKKVHHIVYPKINIKIHKFEFTAAGFYVTMLIVISFTLITGLYIYFLYKSGKLVGTKDIYQTITHQKDNKIHETSINQ